MDSKTVEQFLELLRAGLWGVSPRLGNDVDWSGVMRLAKMQTVQGLIIDGVELLPEAQRPPKDLMLKMLMLKVRLEQTNQLLEKAISEVVAVTDAAGVPSVLLKGSGVAQNYRRPHSRACGDIDLYVGKDNYAKASEAIASSSTEVTAQEVLDEDDMLGAESEKHMHLNYKGITVEVHRVTDVPLDYRKKKLYEEWSDNLLHRSGERMRSVVFDGVSVTLPPANFDAIFIFNHTLHHFVVGGVGLRQFCDWCRYLHARKSEIDVVALEMDLKKLGLFEMWQEFGRFAVCYLGMPREDMLLCSDFEPNRKTERILRLILKEGNFGKYRPEMQNNKPLPYYLRKARSFFRMTGRLAKVIPVSPGLVCMYTIGWFVTGMKAVFKHQ